MKISYHFTLVAALALLMVCIVLPATGKEIYETPRSEKKVKTAMKTLQEGLDELEEALLKDQINLAVKLAHEIDEATHYICNIDLTRSALTKDEQREFERLRKSLHYRVDSMTLAADEGLASVVLDESYKVREACETCHEVFRKK